MEKCGKRYGIVCWGRRRGSGQVLVEMWKSMLGCEGRWGCVEKCWGRCGKVGWGVGRCNEVLGEVWESKLGCGEM